MAKPAWAAATASVALAGLLAVVALDRLAPFPAADVARGSEEAFSSGLHWREFSGPQKTPERWTSERVFVRFQNLSPGSRTLEVALHQHRQPVIVSVEGAIVGSLAPGVTSAEFALPDSARSKLTVELRIDTFVAGDGRRLGARFDRVALRHARGGLPASGTFAPALAALFVLALAAAGGAAAWFAAALALLGLLAQAALLLPMGLLRSGYATLLPLLVIAGAVVAGLFARWRGGEKAPWAFAALLAGCLVQAVALTSPMVVMSDAGLHANKLKGVSDCLAGAPLARCGAAGGGLFPLTETQHARPFKNPYPIAFYLLLAPLVRLGADPVAVVRYGAGLAGALSAGALFVMAEARPRRAALAVLFLLAQPFSSDVFAYGNLSNVFAQAATLGFLAWWLRPAGGAASGTLLLLAAASSHLSSTIVLAVLVPILLFRGRPLERLGRARLLAVVAAAALAALYYARYLPVVFEQLPRLAEGGGSGHRVLGPLEVLSNQARAALGQWGWPLVLLAALGLPRPSRGDEERLLVNVWLSGAVLAVLAVVSPLEVRYLYAVSFAAALAATAGLERLVGLGVPGRAAALGLAGWQLLTALRTLHEILIERYRL